MWRNIQRSVALLVAIVVVFFVSNLVFRHAPDSNIGSTDQTTQISSGFRLKPLSEGFSVVSAGDTGPSGPSDPMKAYPVPSTYRIISGDDASWQFSGTCKAYYYTILIYPAEIDYRQHSNTSVFNEAFVCPSEHKFSKLINNTNIGKLGQKYYAIIADQEQTGSWFNPR